MVPLNYYLVLSGLLFAIGTAGVFLRRNLITMLLSIEVMQERVRQKMEGRTDKQVYLRGDGAVAYRDLMEVVDRLKTAGVTSIGLVTAPPNVPLCRSCLGPVSRSS